jgi:hypothetical protein
VDLFGIDHCPRLMRQYGNPGLEIAADPLLSGVKSDFSDSDYSDVWRDWNLELWPIQNQPNYEHHT